MVGMPWIAPVLKNKLAISDHKPVSTPIPEKIKPLIKARRAGTREVLINPLIAWSSKAMKLAFDFPAFRFSHVYGTLALVETDWATSPRM